MHGSLPLSTNLCLNEFLLLLSFFQPSAAGEPEDEVLGDSGSSDADTSQHAGSTIAGSGMHGELNEVEATEHSLDAENPDGDFVGSATAGSETYEEFDEADCEADNPDNDFLEYVRINSKIRLPHQTTTRLQAMLLILTFVVAAGLNWTQVDALLKLLNTLMGKQAFPSSKYGFRKLWDLQRSRTVEVHPYCPTCQFLTTSCGKNQHCGICRKTKPLVWLLKQGSFFITVDVKHKLLCLLKRTGELVGKKLKELAASPWGGFYADVTDGLLYRRARTEHKMRWSDLTVTINSDGSPVFKSSKSSLWPIQVSLNELPPPHCWKNLIVGAIWFQKEHPPPHLFLKTFVDKFRKIGTLVWSFSGQTVRSAVNAVCCCVDSPARAALLNAKQFNGYYGCSWCYQQGKPVEGEAPLKLYSLQENNISLLQFLFLLRLKGSQYAIRLDKRNMGVVLPPNKQKILRKLQQVEREQNISKVHEPTVHACGLAMLKFVGRLCSQDKAFYSP